MEIEHLTVHVKSYCCLAKAALSTWYNFPFVLNLEGIKVAAKLAL
jgi:hypothetical protein